MLLDNRVGDARAHGVVGNGTSQEINGEEVVEDLLAIGRAEAEDEVNQLRNVSSIDVTDVS